MKRITLGIEGVYNDESAGRLSSAFNDISGIVAAGISVTEQKAVLYTNDLLNKNDLQSVATLSGFGATVLTEDYMVN